MQHPTGVVDPSGEPSARRARAAPRGQIPESGQNRPIFDLLCIIMHAAAGGAGDRDLRGAGDDAPPSAHGTRHSQRVSGAVVSRAGYQSVLGRCQSVRISRDP